MVDRCLDAVLVEPLPYLWACFCDHTHYAIARETAAEVLAVRIKHHIGCGSHTVVAVDTRRTQINLTRCDLRARAGEDFDGSRVSAEGRRSA